MTNHTTAVALLIVLTGTALFARPVEASARHDAAAGDAVTVAAAEVRPPVAFAWRITNGAWDGVLLDGLTVAAIVPGRASQLPLASGAVITVDLRATALQRAALVSLARELSAGRITEVAQVRPSVVRFGAVLRPVDVGADEIVRLAAMRDTRTATPARRGL